MSSCLLRLYAIVGICVMFSPLRAENVGDIAVRGNVLDDIMRMPITTAKVYVIDLVDSSVVGSSTSSG